MVTENKESYNRKIMVEGTEKVEVLKNIITDCKHKFMYEMDGVVQISNETKKKRFTLAKLHEKHCLEGVELCDNAKDSMVGADEHPRPRKWEDVTDSFMFIDLIDHLAHTTSEVIACNQEYAKKKETEEIDRKKYQSNAHITVLCPEGHNVALIRIKVNLDEVEKFGDGDELTLDEDELLEEMIFDDGVDDDEIDYIYRIVISHYVEAEQTCFYEKVYWSSFPNFGNKDSLYINKK